MAAGIGGQVTQMIIDVVIGLLPIVIAIGVLRTLLTSARLKGAIGEKVTSLLVLKKLDPSFYSVHNDVYLPRPDGQGTTQIDHVIVSPFGVFVLEVKNMKGWIFGDEKSKQWTQTLYRKKHRFQNPLHQNQLHVNAFAKAFQVPQDKVKNVVFFVGDATMKTKLPPNVRTSGLKAYLKSHQVQVLGAEECARIRAGLDSLHSKAERKVIAKQHVESVRKRREPV